MYGIRQCREVSYRCPASSPRRDAHSGEYHDQTASLIVPAANISREGANILVAAAVEAAKQAGLEASIAVVDTTGGLKSFGRTDGAPAMTADVAIDKAWTSATSGYPTHVWNELVADPRNAPLVQLPRMMALSGGHPIMSDGKLAGAIGISGGNHEQDLNVALAALKSAGFVE